jgi:hypothetical protein
MGHHLQRELFSMLMQLQVRPRSSATIAWRPARCPKRRRRCADRTLGLPRRRSARRMSPKVRTDLGKTGSDWFFEIADSKSTSMAVRKCQIVTKDGKAPCSDQSTCTQCKTELCNAATSVAPNMAVVGAVAAYLAAKFLLH